MKLYYKYETPVEYNENLVIEVVSNKNDYNYICFKYKIPCAQWIDWHFTSKLELDIVTSSLQKQINLFKRKMEFSETLEYPNVPKRTKTHRVLLDEALECEKNTGREVVS